MEAVSRGGADFARRFWDGAYAAGEDLEHWQRQPPGAGLSRLVEEGACDAGARVLDVGCGTAAEVAWLRSRGVEAFGLDLSLSALARAGAPRPPALVATAFALPLPEASFEVAIDAGCLHTIGPASRPRYARELARVLTPGGRLLVRGAARDDDEQGLVSVAPESCVGSWAGAFALEWSMPIELAAERGTLGAVAALWRRTGGR